jgi:predicted component of type VI protein secretion system
MRFRLRYLHHDLELFEGQFVVGRSASCQLSLDDALVSRRHAMLVVAKDGVTVEDLESRNGVVVNGQKITSRVAVKAGDKIVIGSQELVLHKGVDHTAGRDTGDIKKTLSAMAVPSDFPSDRPAGRAGSVPDRNKGSSAPPGEGDEPSVVRRADQFNLLGGVAEKALALGRAEEAERLLAAPLNEAIEASRAGKKLSVELTDNAARFAAKLATATTKGIWVDYVIDLYQAQGRPCPATVVDELYTAMRKVNGADLTRLRGYVAFLRSKQGSLGPAERFLVQRIEGLERLAALR